MESFADIFSSTETLCRYRDDEALLFSLTNPRPRISADVLGGLERAIEVAERRHVPLVVDSSSANFAFGADLDAELAEAAQGRTDALDAALRNYQRVMLRLRHASIPVVAAVQGAAVSGGCELLMHCSRVVAQSDSRIGLFESAAGVVPAGGGLKEFALRAAQSHDLDASVTAALETISSATIAAAAEARRLGFLTPQDIVIDTDPLEHAVVIARALLPTHTPPASNPVFRIGGRTLLKRLRAAHELKLEHVELTLHQFEVNMRIAEVLCGGDTNADSRSEAELFELERSHFIELAQNPLTQARIAHLRTTRQRLVN